MLLYHPQICLYQPEIPQNAGNIGRLCAGTQCRLHLIRPFGFTTDDRNLRRAGLDYWPFLDLEIHDGIEPLLEHFGDRIAFFSTKGIRNYSEMPVETELLVFGQETKGMPPWIHENYRQQMWRIPMFHSGVRSLNVANSVSAVLYHQLLRRRQHYLKDHTT